MLTSSDTRDAVGQISQPDRSTSATPAAPELDRAAGLRDTSVDVKVVLSGLWIAMLFVFAYVDIFGFFRADIVKGALAGELPDAGFQINQTFLALSTLYILIPSLMVVVSLLAPARINRRANITASIVYAVTVVGTAIGESWTYYVIGSIVEVLLLVAIARVAWTWPKTPTEPTERSSGD